MDEYRKPGNLRGIVGLRGMFAMIGARLRRA